MSEVRTQFGRYELHDRIGCGGMAEIYRARLCGPGGFEKWVAIKRILPAWSSNAEFVRMLVDEAKVLNHLIHPNIVSVYELGTENSQFFITMEYVHGKNLKELIKVCQERQTLLPLPIALYIVQHVLKGLEYAHARKDRSGTPLGIVHRDISPQNIMVSDEGDIKITDFGIARALGRSSETTHTGVVKGKFAYMSPEQARGEEVDLRSDLFSVALVLYECLTNERYFAGKNDLQVLEDVKAHEASDISVCLGDRCPAAIVALLCKALEKNRNDRYPNAAAFLADLNPLLDAYRFDPIKADTWVDPEVYFSTLLRGELSLEGLEPESAPTHTPTLKTLPTASRRRRPTAVTIALAALALVVGVAVLSREEIIKRASLFGDRSIAHSVGWSEVKPIPDPAPIVSQKVAVQDVVSQPVAAKGRLKVSAIPWGVVDVSGVGKKFEAPLARQVPVGNYPITVSYNGRSLSATAVVKSDTETVCKATFTPGKEEVFCR